MPDPTKKPDPAKQNPAESDPGPSGDAKTTPPDTSQQRQNTEQGTGRRVSDQG